MHPTVPGQLKAKTLPWRVDSSFSGPGTPFDVGTIIGVPLALLPPTRHCWASGHPTAQSSLPEMSWTATVVAGTTTEVAAVAAGAKLRPTATPSATADS